MLTSHQCFHPGVCATGRRIFRVFPRSVCHQEQRELGCNITVQYNRLVPRNRAHLSGSAAEPSLDCTGAEGEAPTHYICTTEDILIGNERGKRMTSCTVQT
ncbi:hypothetical protein EPR50_G00027760 [Perca flavescens]|uniref:Uncharacterized protein n=1 Tax=Perca flavescens TaxID=8167 RepID=A0A484DKR0_PERFV|nr:hypothetical protein EPR50_G00027760 [Perca flavescens]